MGFFVGKEFYLEVKGFAKKTEAANAIKKEGGKINYSITKNTNHIVISDHKGNNPPLSYIIYSLFNSVHLLIFLIIMEINLYFLFFFSCTFSFSVINIDLLFNNYIIF